MQKKTPILIRIGKLPDLPAITDIYNEAILNTTATMDTEPKTVQERLSWFEAHNAQQPIFVAEIAGKVVGWGTLTRWSDRVAYRFTAETSVYVDSSHRRQGIGRALNDKLIATARQLGYRSLMARIVGDNVRSVEIHQHAGFELIGTMREAGYKFDTWLDVHLLQKMLD